MEEGFYCSGEAEGEDGGDFVGSLEGVVEAFWGVGGFVGMSTLCVGGIGCCHYLL